MADAQSASSRRAGDPCEPSMAAIRFAIDFSLNPASSRQLFGGQGVDVGDVVQPASVDQSR